MSSSNKLHIQVLPHAQDTATFAKLNFRLHLYFWNVQLVTVYDLIIREGFSQLPKDSRWPGLHDGEPSQGQGVSGPRGDGAQQRAGVGPLLRPSLRPRSRGASDLQGTVSGVPPAHTLIIAYKGSWISKTRGIPYYFQNFDRFHPLFFASNIEVSLIFS